MCLLSTYSTLSLLLRDDDPIVSQAARAVFSWLNRLLVQKKLPERQAASLHGEADHLPVPGEAQIDALTISPRTRCYETSNDLNLRDGPAVEGCRWQPLRGRLERMKGEGLVTRLAESSCAR